MELLEQFKQYLLEQKDAPSRATVKNYLADARKFVKWFEETYKKTFDPSIISNFTIDEFSKSKKTHVSARSVERYLSTLRKFFQFLKMDGIIPLSPFEMSEVRNQKLEVDPWHIKEFKDYLYVYNSSHLTIKNYVIDVKQFMSWLEEVTGVKETWDVREKNIFNKIDNGLVEEYKSRLLESGLSPNSINRKLSSIRKYTAWAKSEGLLRDVSSSKYQVASIKPA